jgi:hypothetical protein
LEIARRHSIPVITGRFEAQCGQWRKMRGSRTSEERYRRKAISYHDSILERIRRFEQSGGWPFDLAVLAYRRWIHGGLLTYFADRMINQHAGDLTLLDANLKRQLIGINPVFPALESGLTRTRTSTFLVNQGHDAGEILCQGPWVPYGGGPVTRHSAWEHELIQKRASDWPSLRFALRGIAAGDFAVGSVPVHPDGGRRVYYRGVPLDHGGVDLSITAR